MRRELHFNPCLRSIAPVFAENQLEVWWFRRCPISGTLCMLASKRGRIQRISSVYQWKETWKSLASCSAGTSKLRKCCATPGRGGDAYRKHVTAVWVATQTHLPSIFIYWRHRSGRKGSGMGQSTRQATIVKGSPVCWYAILLLGLATGAGKIPS